MNHLLRCDAAPATVKSLLITTGYTKPGQRIQRLLTAKLQATLKPKSAKAARGNHEKAVSSWQVALALPTPHWATRPLWGLSHAIEHPDRDPEHQGHRYIQEQPTIQAAVGTKNI